MAFSHVKWFLLIVFSLLVFSSIIHGKSIEGLGRTSHVIKILSTNTRSGFVDVNNIVNHQAGQNILDSSVIPDNIYHGAIQAFGKVYDFILDRGIIITEQGKYYSENNPLWIDAEFSTYKTEKEFETWLKKETAENFTLTSYRLADNNCLTFVHKATKFLGGTEPKKLWKVRQFALNNRKNLEVLQALYRAWKPPPTTVPNQL